MADQKLTTLAKRLRPFFAGQVGAMAGAGALMTEGPGIDLVGKAIGLGGDSILLYFDNGSPAAEYAATQAGLIAALAAATSGDIVRLPYANVITLTTGVTVGAGVTVEGFGVGTSTIKSSGDVGAVLVTLSGAAAKLENLSVTYLTANSANARYAVYMTGATSSCRRLYARCYNAGAGAGTGIHIAPGSGLAYVSYSTGAGESGSGSGIGINCQENSDIRSCHGITYSTNGNSSGIVMSGAVARQCEAEGDPDTNGKYGYYVYSESGSLTSRIYDGNVEGITTDYDLYIADANTTLEVYGLNFDTYKNAGGIVTFGGGDRESVAHRHEVTTTAPGGTLNLIDSPVTVIDNALNNSFPSIVKMANGNLLVVYRAGVGHSGDKGSIKSKISTDNGATWGVEANVYTHATLDSRDPCLSVLADGTVWLSFFLAVAATGAHIADGVRVSSSADNGATWSAPATIDSAFTGDCACSGPIIEYPFGRLALPMHGLNAGDTHYSSSVIFSNDDGANWINETVIADGERDSRMYAEPNLVYLDYYGLTLCMMRSDTPDAANGDFYASFSTDDGFIWSVPSSKFAATGAPRMCQLKNHMLMIIYRNNAAPTEALYKISRTNGYNWSASTVLNDDAIVQMTYAGAVEYDEGVIGAVVGVENVLAGDSDVFYYRLYTTVEAGQLQSNVPTGVAPIVINSTTAITNLNSELWNGESNSITGAASGDIFVYDGADWINSRERYRKITTVTTGTYALDETYDVVVCDCAGGDVEISLPNLTNYDGKEYTIKKIDSSANDVIITPDIGNALTDSDGDVITDSDGDTLYDSGSGTANLIDGDVEMILDSQYDAIQIVGDTDGLNWWII